jgi:hypothetical protein
MPRADQIRDREALTDHIADVMHARCPAFTVDALLAHPLEALVVAIDVADRAGRVNRTKARAALKALGEFEQLHGACLEPANEVCRCALSARKRGALKSKPEATR